jgi:hypothetical protein
MITFYIDKANENKDYSLSYIIIPYKTGYRTKSGLTLSVFRGKYQYAGAKGVFIHYFLAINITRLWCGSELVARNC